MIIKDGNQLVEVYYEEKRAEVNIEEILDEYRFKRNMIKDVTPRLQELTPCLRELGLIDAAGEIIETGNKINLDQMVQNERSQ